MSPFDQNIDYDAGHTIDPSIDQNDLIAFHLHELSPSQERALHRVLRTSPALQAESVAIATTLRAFPKHEAALPLDAAALDRHWLALRPALVPHILPAAPPRSLFPSSPLFRWGLPALAGSALVTTALLVALHYSRQTSPIAPTLVATAQSSTSTPTALALPPPSNPALNNPAPSSSSPFTASTPYPSTIDQPPPPASTPLNAALPETTPTQPLTPAAPTLASPEHATAPTTESQASQPNNPSTSLSPTQIIKPRPLKIHHPHPADFTLAMFGNLPAGNSSSSTSGTGTSAVTQSLSQTATNAVGALASFHQQFSPWIGYRITTTYSRPTFEATSGTSTSSGSYSTGSYPIAQSIYELSGTYTVQGPRHGRLSTSVEAGASLLAFSSINPYPIPSTNVHSFHAAAVAGIGSELALSKHLALHAEYRVLLYKPPAFYVNDTAPTSGNLTLGNEPVFGITYRFGTSGED